MRHLLHGRPTGPANAFNASEFWRNENGKNRAVLIYALLTRPGTITDLIQQDDAPRLLPDVSKLYTFLREWGIDFKSFDPPPRIHAVGRDHRIVRGVLEHDHDGYHIRTPTRRLALEYQAWGEWRIQRDPGDDVPLTTALHAARLAGLTGKLRDYLHDVSMAHTGHGLTHKDTGGALPKRGVEAAVGESTLEAASIHANHCRCQYWDDERLQCGIDPRRRTVPSECPDYTPLEVSWSASKSPEVQHALASPAKSTAATDESAPPSDPSGE